MQSLSSIRHTIESVRSRSDDHELRRLCQALADLVRHVEQLANEVSSLE
jgi:hypothetical protein